MQVSLNEIEYISISDLNQGRLDTLQNGYNSFEEVLNSSSDPIKLDCSSSPYKVIDGRHRIYLAREKGYSTINANC